MPLTLPFLLTYVSVRQLASPLYQFVGSVQLRLQLNLLAATLIPRSKIAILGRIVGIRIRVRTRTRTRKTIARVYTVGMALTYTAKAIQILPITLTTLAIRYTRLRRSKIRDGRLLRLRPSLQPLYFFSIGNQERRRLPTPVYYKSPLRRYAIKRQRRVCLRVSTYIRRSPIRLVYLQRMSARQYKLLRSRAAQTRTQLQYITAERTRWSLLRTGCLLLRTECSLLQSRRIVRQGNSTIVYSD